MTKAEHIKFITESLPALSEDQLVSIRKATTAWLSLASTFEFSDEEKAAIARSFDDYKHGRTFTLDEVEAGIRKRFARPQN
jgi:uncharacterized phage-associated protein